MSKERGRPAGEPVSFGQVVEQQAAGPRSAKRAFVFLGDGEEETARLTYAEIDSAGRRIAAALESRGAAGGPVLLLYPPGLEFVCAFIGCLYAGAIAVPAYAERRRGGRLAAVLRDARPRLALTTTKVLSRTPEVSGEIEAIATDELEGDVRGWRPPVIGPDDVAFLQRKSPPVGPEVPVGVLLDRSPELAVAVLAVLEAGGGFLAVEASEPARRIAWLLGDSGAPVVVTARAAVGRLSSGPWRWVTIDDGRPGRITDAARRVEADALAYLIYTSGSTGRPKGVLAHHGGLANLVAAIVRATRMGPGCRVLQFASLAFDMSVLEILAALASGATLCPVDERARLSGRALGTAIRDGNVTHAILTPSVLGLLSERECPTLTTIISGGEALAPELADRWSAGRRLMNGYGPAETAICSTLYPCLPGGSAVAIGRPVAKTRVHVVDRGLRSLPPVVPGELAIGGGGVTRGYLGRPALTAECFVPDLFGALGARLYRTGDLVRRRGDGNLEFLGRIDAQLRVRGVRIEPEEVEEALVRHPEVAAAAVVQRGDHLVGYVVSAPAGRPSAAELRRFLSSILPDPMVPTAFVTLEALPLSRSGKVDRRALPDVETPPEAAGAFRRTELERTLATIWSEELGLKTVGVDRNFFELGGHSLVMARIHARLCDVLGREVPLVEAFSHPSVSALAAHLEGGGTSREEESLAAVKVRGAARGAAMSAMLRPRGE